MKRGSEYWLCLDCTEVAVGDANLDYHYSPEEAQARLDLIEANMPPNLVADWRDEQEWECTDCGWIGIEEDCPTVQDPDGEGGTIFVCPSCNSEDLRRREHGYDEFSREECECCGTHLAGSRYRFVQLLSDLT
jgi:ribosomal protein L37AE/L43A